MSRIPPKTPRPSRAGTQSGANKKQNNSATFASQAEQEILGCIVNSTSVLLTDIIGNETAKKALEEVVILPILNPSLFKGLRTPAKGILLFGPPGNGKTLLAKAVANEAHCRFFNISAATIMSKWVGEGEKMMRELFKIAKLYQPSIIFIDELDSMLSARGEEENGSARRVKTEFLLQFDGMTTSDDDRILLLGATNRPFELDEGVLRRFPRRIFIDLPNADARKALILANVRKNNMNIKLKEDGLRRIAEKTEGYSFSDITSLCREAAMAPVRELSREQLRTISERQIRPVTYEDLEQALSVIRPSTSEASRKKIAEFAAGYAQVQ